MTGHHARVRRFTDEELRAVERFDELRAEGFSVTAAVSEVLEEFPELAGDVIVFLNRPAPAR